MSGPLFRSARWICAPEFAGLAPRQLLRKQYASAPALDPHPPQLLNHHWLVRRGFQLEGAPPDAELTITADDYYQLWINEAFVGQGPAPSYPHRYRVNRWPVAQHLRRGPNVIAVRVYYQGLVNRVWNSGDLRQGLISELVVDAKTVIATDATWRCTRDGSFVGTATVGYQTQYLEDMDSRLAPVGWRSRDHDDSAWSSPAERTTDHVFELQETPPVAVHQLAPRTIETLPGGGVRLDFGHELTGALTMRARGRSGDTVEIRCGEELSPDGSVRHAMRCNCDYRETWTLSGGDDVLEPFDYKAFRHAEVLAPPGIVDPASIRAVVRHYPLEPSRSAFASSSPELDAIWSICRAGVTYGLQEGYLDCPSREKGQYLGDMTVAAHAHWYVSGDARPWRKGLHDFADSAAICPGLMAVAPGAFMQEIADFSLQYPLQLHRYWRHTGDQATARALLPVAEGVLEHFRRCRDEDGLLRDVIDKWNLVDWPPPLRDGYDFPLGDPPTRGQHTVVNAFHIGAIDAVNALRGELGLPVREDTAPLRAAFVRRFWHPEQGAFVDAPGSSHASLHANVLPLLFGIAPPEATAPLVALIRRKRFACGVYFAYFVLQALARVGEHALVHELITCDDERSWRTMLRDGATTCFEAWGKDQKWNTSFCHPWAAAPIPLLVEAVAGLTPAEPGWTRVAFRPRIPPALQRLSLAFTVPTGRIEFEHRDGRTTLRVPDGVPVDRG